MCRLLGVMSIIAGLTSSAFGTLVAGDLAVVGRINNGTPDSFAVAPLVNLSAGEVIYFTDNGWTGSQFRGATATDGDGNESLIKLTVNSSIAAGTLISTSATDPSFTWTKTGSVPGGTSGNFADLSFSTGGDQIYAFQGPTNLPLFNPSNHIFLLDDTGALENATDSNTGSAAPGLTLGSTALAFAPSPLAGIFRLVNDGVQRTKPQWLSYIATSSNWTAAASGNLSSTGNLLVAVPEASAVLFAGLACCASATAYGIRRRLFAKAD